MVGDNVRVDALFTEDMLILIKQLGLREAFERGECHCHICNDVVNHTNLKLIFPTEDHTVGFICNKPQCFVEFALQE